MKTVFIENAEVVGRSIGRFPLVLDDEDAAVLDIMRYLLDCLAKGAAVRSLETYATHLRDFHSQLLVDSVEMRNVSDAYLTAYHCEISRRASATYASQIVRTVLSFLLYLEERGAISWVIGETSRHLITITRTKNGSVSHRLSRGGKSPKSNYYPSDRAIDIVKCSISSVPTLIERNSIMVDWGHVRGLRAMEICSLRTRQLPDRESVERALEDDRVMEVRLTRTKGDKPRLVEVHPLLLARTWKWIDTGRTEILRGVRRRAAAKGLSVSTSDAIFVSESTGKALSPKSFSNAIRKAFRKAVSAGDLTAAERVWAHGLRKRMVNREVKESSSLELGRKEHELRHQTGHGSLEALGTYVAAEK